MQDIWHGPGLCYLNLAGFVFWLWSLVKQKLGLQVLWLNPLSTRMIVLGYMTWIQFWKYPRGCLWSLVRPCSVHKVHARSVHALYTLRARFVHPLCTLWKPSMSTPWALRVRSCVSSVHTSCTLHARSIQALCNFWQASCTLRATTVIVWPCCICVTMSYIVAPCCICIPM